MCEASSREDNERGGLVWESFGECARGRRLLPTLPFTRRDYETVETREYRYKSDQFERNSGNIHSTYMMRRHFSRSLVRRVNFFHNYGGQDANKNARNVKAMTVSLKC